MHESSGGNEAVTKLGLNIEPMSEEKPLITFALFAYNQEHCVRNAIEGAFSQTYTPLEIILSDDCSGDGTYEVMQSMADSYAGPHTIRLNRNSVNLGIGGHIAKLAELARGDWITVAAGDDVSLPTRVQTVYEIAKQCKNPKAIATIGTGDPQYDSSFGSDLRIVTASELIKSEMLCTQGAFISYSADCFHWPDEYPHECWYEDRILPLRAALLGELVVTDHFEVNYTRGQKTWSSVVVNLSQMKHVYEAANKAIRMAVREKRLGWLSAKCNLVQLRLSYWKLLTTTKFRNSKSTLERFILAGKIHVLDTLIRGPFKKLSRLFPLGSRHRRRFVHPHFKIRD
ncbi:MAG TPA: glycosyltransferase family 2 protein [Pirellulaceae bacterium]|nr:glycosyltransferase family 2 protein [Pirellulaceae bacterium]HMO93443.1 glycosyltransferase family 2 protein [Pirellulaceae bacterium]HMP68449.1 glycosyltransferase family 2 protein [Pirellulaceae bacterium]